MSYLNFRSNDTRFGIGWHTGPREVLDARKARAVFVVSLLGVLRADGFEYGPDGKVDPCIQNCYWHGRRGELQFVAEHHPAISSIEFYQDVYNVSNKHGGRYDFDKLARMPYLMQKRVQMLHARLGRVLLGKGFDDDSERPAKDAAGEIERQRARYPGHHDNATASYNCLDANSVPLRDGMIRYYYDYRGRLRRGVVRHNINNMWWVLASPTEYHNEACFRFFADPTGKPLRSVDPIASMKRDLSRAIQEERFLRAEQIKNAILRATGAQAVRAA